MLSRSTTSKQLLETFDHLKFELEDLLVKYFRYFTIHKSKVYALLSTTKQFVFRILPPGHISDFIDQGSVLI